MRTTPSLHFLNHVLLFQSKQKGENPHNLNQHDEVRRIGQDGMGGGETSGSAA